MYYIYRHILPDGKSYIGLTKDTKSRWKKSLYKKCPKFYKAILKYGWDNIKHEILYATEDDCKARGLEKEMIKKYDSIKKGYNSINKELKNRSKRKEPLYKYLQFDLDGNFIAEYKNSRELRNNGFIPDYIRACCNGRIQTSQGYKWKKSIVLFCH